MRAREVLRLFNLLCLALCVLCVPSQAHELLDVRFEFGNFTGTQHVVGQNQTVRIHVLLAGYGEHDVELEVLEQGVGTVDELEKSVGLDGVTDVVFNYTPGKLGRYFVRVYVDGSRADDFQYLSAEDRPGFVVLKYYWYGLKVDVDGEVYDDDSFPCPSNARVRVYGKLQEDGEPVANAEVVAQVIAGQEMTTRTDSDGHFELSFSAPDWESLNLCGKRTHLFTLYADLNGNGKFDFGDEPRTRWYCECECPSATPAPTETPSAEWNFDLEGKPVKPALVGLGCFTLCLMLLLLVRR